MTTAPRAAQREGGQQRPRNSIVSSTVTSATREYSWVRLPTRRRCAVRLPLLLTGKPWNRPAADVGRTEREQLLAASIPRAVGGERARGQDVVGVGDDGDAERGR